MQIKKLLLFLFLSTILSCSSPENSILFDTKVIYIEAKTMHGFYYSSAHPELFMITTTYSNSIEKEDKLYLNNNGYFLAMEGKKVKYSECSGLAHNDSIIYKYHIDSEKVIFKGIVCTKIILIGKRSNYAIEILVSEDNVINNTNLITLNFNIKNQPLTITGLIVKIDEVAYLGKERVERNWLTYVKTEKTERELDIDLNRFK